MHHFVNDPETKAIIDDISNISFVEPSVKNEPITIKKCKQGQLRLIYNIAPVLRMFNILVNAHQYKGDLEGYTPMREYLTAATSALFNGTFVDPATRLTQFTHQHGEVITYDVDGWDTRLPIVAMLAAFESTHPDLWTTQCAALVALNCLTRVRIHHKEKFVDVGPKWPSGLGITLHGNSGAHHYMTKTCGLTSREHTLETQGDDGCSKRSEHANHVRRLALFNLSVSKDPHFCGILVDQGDLSKAQKDAHHVGSVLAQSARIMCRAKFFGNGQGHSAKVVAGNLKQLTFVPHALIRSEELEAAYNELGVNTAFVDALNAGSADVEDLTPIE